MYNSLVTYINYIEGGLPNLQGVRNTQGGIQKCALQKNICGFFGNRMRGFSKRFRIYKSVFLSLQNTQDSGNTHKLSWNRATQLPRSS